MALDSTNVAVADATGSDAKVTVDLGLLGPETLEELRLLAQLFEEHGHQVRVAGGAVRDLLSGKVPEDVDLATTATPKEMVGEISAGRPSSSIRVASTAGEKHGTVLFRVCERTNFEVTTLRVDEVCDGRWVTDVRFTEDWRLDAGRRDLTVNSMFVGLDGTLYDYFGGLEDLKQRRVAFVGDPATRIKEDYLRILRYFRFYGRLAKSPDSHDELTMKAIRENAQGMAGISGERIWSEWKKILIGKFGAQLTRTMVKVAGLGPHIGLPDSPDMDELTKVKDICDKRGLSPLAPTLLAALLRSEEELRAAQDRLKMSCNERDLAIFVIAHRADADQAVLTREDPMHLYRCLAIDATASNAKLKGDRIRTLVAEVMVYRGEVELRQQWESSDLPSFPVDGKALKSAGVPPGKTYSKILAYMRERWKDSRFKLGLDDLMELLPEAVKHSNQSSPR